MTKSVTNKIFIFNTIVIVLMLITDKFWDKLGLTEYEDMYYTLIGIIIFGISIGGIFIGFMEYKIKKEKSIIGIVGNSTITLIFLIVIFITFLRIKK